MQESLKYQDLRNVLDIKMRKNKAQRAEEVKQMPGNSEK